MIATPDPAWRAARLRLVLAAVVAIALAFVVNRVASTPEPTPDQRYGCSLAQQASNGDCP